MTGAPLIWVEAILAHQGDSLRNPDTSAANSVIARYHNLTEGQKHDLLNFLRSL